MPTFRCIIAPTDFSSGAARAIDRASNLPLARSGQLHLVHVVPAGDDSERRALESKRALAKEVARIRERMHGLDRKGPRIVARTLTGEPYVEIIRYARSVDAELVVAGRNGAGQSLKKVLGTTAARIVRMADVPVLVAGIHPPSRSYKRPLVAADADASVRRIIELVQRLVGDGISAKGLDVVHAYHVPFEGFLPPGTPEQPSVHHRQVKQAATAAFDDLIKSIERENLKINPLLRKGEARTVIAEEAIRTRADLIALGTHGRSGLAHALLGSVAEWVVANVPQDILIARPVRFTFAPP